MKHVQPALACFRVKKYVETASGSQFEVKLPGTAQEGISCERCKRKFSSQKYFLQHIEWSKSCKGTATAQQQERLSPPGTFKASEGRNVSTFHQLNDNLVLEVVQSENSKSQNLHNELKQQAEHRKSYTVDFKANVINSSGKLQKIAEKFGISKSLVSKWMKCRVQILKACEESKRKELGGRRQVGSRITRSRRKIRNNTNAHFKLAEQRVMEDFKVIREKGLKVSHAWIVSGMRKFIRQFYGDHKADSFKASKNWMAGFKARHKISLHRRTNKKAVGSMEMLPILQNFHRQLKKDVGSCRGRDGGIKDQVWGRWLPEARYNVDQVPLPFIVDQDTTYETTGSTSVWIAQPSSGLDKRQCTLQLCIRPSDQQPVPPAVIFRGKGKIKEEELKLHDPRVHVFWQKNGWMDKEVALQWVEKTFSPSIDKSQENVLFLDNLSCQTSQEFIVSCRRKANTVVYPLPPSSTDKVQPVDAGEGRQMKKLIGEQLDKYLEDDANMKTWCGESFSASKRRIMITKWVGAAWEEMRKYKNYRQR